MADSDSGTHVTDMSESVHDDAESRRKNQGKKSILY